MLFWEWILGAEILSSIKLIDIHSSNNNLYGFVSLLIRLFLLRMFSNLIIFAIDHRTKTVWRWENRWDKFLILTLVLQAVSHFRWQLTKRSISITMKIDCHSNIPVAHSSVAQWHLIRDIVNYIISNLSNYLSNNLS